MKILGLMSPKLENTWPYEPNAKHNSDPIGVHPGKGPNRVRAPAEYNRVPIKRGLPSPEESESDEARGLICPKLENTGLSQI